MGYVQKLYSARNFPCNFHRICETFLLFEKNSSRCWKYIINQIYGIRGGSSAYINFTENFYRNINRKLIISNQKKKISKNLSLLGVTWNFWELAAWVSILQGQLQRPQPQKPDNIWRCIETKNFRILNINKHFSPDMKL